MWESNRTFSQREQRFNTYLVAILFEVIKDKNNTFNYYYIELHLFNLTNPIFEAKDAWSVCNVTWNIDARVVPIYYT